MAKRKKSSKKGKKKEGILLGTSTDRSIWHGVLVIVAFIVTVLFTLSAFRLAGPAGEKIRQVFVGLVGSVGYPLLPLSTGFLGISLLRKETARFAWRHIISSIIFLLSSLGIAQIALHSGGIIGRFLSQPLIDLFDEIVSLIFLIGLALIGFLILFNINLIEIIHKINLNLPKHKDEDFDDDEDPLIIDTNEEEEPIKVDLDEEPTKKENKKIKIPSLGKKKKAPAEEEITDFPDKIVTSLKPYTPPPISLLQRDRGRPDVGDVKANATLIKRTLKNFNIDVEMDEISIGPSVTRYALKPAQGVKLSRIVNLQKDLSLALAASSLRIEAPIPGKALVGIEVPNKMTATIGLGSLISSHEFAHSDKSLLVSLGKGISGKAYFANLAKMPHLLVAGATGSGKSVTVHNLIVSLLYRNSPDQLKLILIDPKRVELTLYNKIPHLLTPVIKDAKKSILALKWAVKEMERRYDLLEQNKVRDIASYHKNILAPALKRSEKNPDTEQPDLMPYIVIIIDELADLMQAYPRELEAGIVRLAQMSRAVGIHLILSTQRPSVNVITGLIKANIPARIALQVSSQIDSRTIIDAAGAEKLLGKGDMLYAGGEMSRPVRIQSAFVTEDEVKKIVKYLVKNHDSDLPDEIDLDGDDSNQSDALFASVMEDEADENRDSMYKEAKDLVIKTGKASTSYLQRRLRLGYSRAARIIDELEDDGVIGPAAGSKPRDVLIKPDRVDDHAKEMIAEAELEEAEDESTADDDLKINEYE